MHKTQEGCFLKIHFIFIAGVIVRKVIQITHRARHAVVVIIVVEDVFVVEIEIFVIVVIFYHRFIDGICWFTDYLSDYLALGGGRGGGGGAGFTTGVGRLTSGLVAFWLLSTFFASRLLVVVGTAMRRFLSINWPVSEQIP